MKKYQPLIMAISVLISLTSVYAGKPTELLKQSIDKVLEVLNNPELQGDDRQEERWSLLRNILEERFNFREMSKRALGKAWNKLTSGERDEFVDVFQKLLERTYLTRVEQEASGKVTFGKERTLGKNKVVVETKAISADKEIPIHYNLMNKQEKWTIYDVKIEGVGLIKNYRTQFREFLQKKSFQELLAQLKEKNERQE